jgi:hypothetical protein
VRRRTSAAVICLMSSSWAPEPGCFGPRTEVLGFGSSRTLVADDQKRLAHDLAVFGSDLRAFERGAQRHRLKITSRTYAAFLGITLRLVVPHWAGGVARRLSRTLHERESRDRCEMDHGRQRRSRVNAQAMWTGPSADHHRHDRCERDSLPSRAVRVSRSRARATAPRRRSNAVLPVQPRLHGEDSVWRLCVSSRTAWLGGLPQLRDRPPPPFVVSRQPWSGSGHDRLSPLTPTSTRAARGVPRGLSLVACEPRAPRRQRASGRLRQRRPRGPARWCSSRGSPTAQGGRCEAVQAVTSRPAG